MTPLTSHLSPILHPYESAGVEAMLDIEYLGSLTAPIPMSFFYLGQYSLTKWADLAMTTPNTPWGK